MSQVPFDPELSSIEAALGDMTPSRSRLDRDRLMFEAGAASARQAARRPLVWPSIAAMLALVAVSESVALLAVRNRSAAVVVQQPVPAMETPAAEPQVQILSQSTQPAASDRQEWLTGGGQPVALRRQVLRFGLEGLPDPPPLLTHSGGTAPAADGAESPPPLRRFELNKVLDLGGPT